MRKFLLLTILPIFVFSKCDSGSGKISTLEINSIEIAKDYDDLGRNLVSWEEIFSFDLKHFYVYFFSRTCSHCLNLKKSILYVISVNEEFFACESNGKHKFCNFPLVGEFDAVDFCIVGYPSIVEFKNNEIVNNIVGETAVLEFLTENNLYK